MADLLFDQLDLAKQVNLFLIKHKQPAESKPAKQEVTIRTHVVKASVFITNIVASRLVRALLVDFEVEEEWV